MKLRVALIGMFVFFGIACRTGASTVLVSDFSAQPLGILQGASVTWSDTNAILQGRTNLIEGDWITISNATSPYLELPGLPMDFFRLDFGAVAAGVPPTANNDSYSVTHDQVLSVPPPGVLGNDLDNNNLPMTATLESGPGNGTLSFNPDGSFDYTPNPGYVGVDSFTYVASDELGVPSASATVQITVINNPPVAVNDSYGVQMNETLYVAAPGVLANDTDADGDALTALLATAPSNGTLALNADGSFQYTPNTNFFGTDTFTYYDNDGITNGDIATVTLNVHSNNTPPVAISSEYMMAQGGELSVPAPGVLTGATDADGDVLSAQLIGAPAGGIVTLNSDGSFQYAPTNGFLGTDSFTFAAFDGLTNGNTATVTIYVTNGAPAATALTYYIHFGGVLSVPPSGVLVNDTSPVGDPLVAQLASPPSLGTMALNSDGSFNYTNTDLGVDSFGYQAVDAFGYSTSSVAMVTIIITNRPPVAVADAYGVLWNTTLNVPAPGVLANDSDPDGDSLTAALATGTSDGSLTLNANGSFSYVPGVNFTGTDSFTYMAFDGAADSTPVMVTIMVHSNSVPPAPGPSFYTIRPDETLTVSNDETVLNDDADIDNDVMTAALLSEPANGTLSFNTNGDFVYVPNDGFVGSDSFTYQPDDGPTPGSPATVYISVVNTAPAASSDEYTFHFVTPTDDVTNYTVPAPGVLENDFDADQDELTADLVTSTTNGTLTLDEDGSFTYTPNPGFVGIDTFSYVADDGYTTSAVATVTLNITDTAPMAQPDTFAVAANSTLNVAVPGPLENADDADTDPLTAVLGTGTSNGSLALNADGSFTYTPNAGFSGTDSFTYSATDGGLTSSPTTVTIDVTNNVIITTIKPSATPAAHPKALDPSVTLSQLTFDNVIQTPNLPAAIGKPTGRAIYSDWAGALLGFSPPKENGIAPFYNDGKAWAYGWRWGTTSGYIPSFNGAGSETRYPYIYARNNVLAASVQIKTLNIPAGSMINLAGDVYMNGEATKALVRFATVGLPAPSLIPAGNFLSPGGALNGRVATTLAYTKAVGGVGAVSVILTPNGTAGQWSSTPAGVGVLPGTVGSNVMTIVWHYTYRTPAGVTSLDSVCGVSKHIIYITYGQTFLQRDYWTPVDVGCTRAPALVANLPLYSQTLHIAAIYRSQFSTLLAGGPGNMKRVDGAPLSFYGTAIQPSGASPYWRSYTPNGWAAPQAGNGPDLLRYGAGWNRAWTHLFQMTLLAQGLTDNNGVPVGTLNTITANNNDDGFLLKGTLPAAGAGPFKAATTKPYIYANWVYPKYQQGNNAQLTPAGPRWRFVFKPAAGGNIAPTVSSINGQNDAPALAAPAGFNTVNFGGAPNWWFIDWTLKIGNTLYTPAYGRQGSLSDLQGAMIDGTFKFDTINNNSTTFNMRKTTAAGNAGKVKLRFLTIAGAPANLTVTLNTALDNNFNAGGAVDRSNGKTIKLTYWTASPPEWVNLRTTGNQSQTVNGVATFMNVLNNNPRAPAHGLIRASADWYGTAVISY